MNEAYVIRMIQEYIEECLAIPITTNEELKNIFFYSQWAANEILNRIIDELSRLPAHITGREPRSHIEIIKEFVDEMDYYYHKCETKVNKLIYSSARTTGMEILYLFE